MSDLNDMIVELTVKTDKGELKWIRQGKGYVAKIGMNQIEVFNYSPEVFGYFGRINGVDFQSTAMGPLYEAILEYEKWLNNLTLQSEIDKVMFDLKYDG